MMIKQDPAPVPVPVPAACGNCSSSERRRLLHHVRHRGIFRRLCTPCVLKLHPQSFCPTCFLVYDRPQSSNDAVTCFKCYSYTHPHCLSSNSSIPKPYICPSCSNPNSPIFVEKKAKNEVGVEENFWVIDKNAARVLLAAARIASGSMSRAVEASKLEAERRAKEAALTRKRAREALEHVAFLVTKEKLKRKEVFSPEVSGSGNVGTPGENRKRGGVSRIEPPPAMAEVAAQKVLASLKAVDLRGEERLQGFKAQSGVSEVPPNNGLPMDMVESERLRVSSVSDNHGFGNENGGSGDLGNMESNCAQEEKVMNGQFSVLAVGDPMQHMQQNSHSREENVGQQIDV